MAEIRHLENRRDVILLP